MDNDASLRMALLQTLRAACDAVAQGQPADFEYYWDVDGESFRPERLNVLPRQSAEETSTDDSRVQVGTPGLLSSLKFHPILAERE
eukprot:COSAG04_NODE_31322_length_257_cov_0.746835_1_plen_85_part_11